MADDRPSVSVLICTAGRPALLHRALDHLALGLERPDQVVIVNGGDDRANEAVARYCGAFVEVLLLQYENQNLAVSRNLGLPLCKGDIIALTDDDAVVSSDWIAALRRAHVDDPGAGAVGGPVRGSVADSFLSRVADRVVFPYFPDRRFVRTIPGVNASYKSSVVKRVGFFDESLFRGEDVDYNWRVLQDGHHILYDPAIQVEHEHRVSLLGLLQQQWMYGRAYVLVRSKWPEMYCVYPRNLRTFRDWAKAVHCLVAVIYQPALAAHRMGRIRESVQAYPLLVAHHAVWKLAMLQQGIALPGPTRDRVNEAAASKRRVNLMKRWHRGELVEMQESQ